MLRQSFTGHKKALVLVGLLFAACATAVALAVSVSASTSSRPLRHVPAVPGGKTPLSAALVRRSSRNDHLLARTFAVFRAAHAAFANPSLPTRIAEHLKAIDQGSTPIGQIAPNPALAVYVGSVQAAALNDTMSVWLIPGATGVCIAEEAPAAKSAGTTCVSDQESAAGHLEGLLASSGGVVTDYGVLPGDATTATVTNANGSSTTVPVTNGLWVINGDTEARSLSASSLSAPLALPADPSKS